MGQPQSTQLCVGKPVVLILGGGYGGVAVAKALDKSGLFNVVLVDRKNYFLHNLGALRAAVDPLFGENITIPYDRLLTNGVVVQAEVADIDSDSVRLHGKPEPIPFDYCVIALGTSYAFPGKISEPCRADTLLRYYNVHKLINEKTDITIIGGGAVGVELAGEIATEYPLSKRITLIHSGDRLITGNPLGTKFRENVLSELRLLGVTVMLGHRAALGELQNSSATYIEGRRTLITDKGSRVDTDIVFLCTGASANCQSLKKYFGDRLDVRSGRISVDRYLRVVGCRKIFAVGDINNVEEIKLAYYAQKQGEVCAHNIIAQNNNSRMKPYKKGSPMMFVTLGRYGGVGQLPIGGFVVGNAIVRSVKSRDFFYKDYLALLNQHDTSGPGADSDIQHQNFAEVMKMSKEDAEKILKDGMAVVTHKQGATHT